MKKVSAVARPANCDKSRHATGEGPKSGGDGGGGRGDGGGGGDAAAHVTLTPRPPGLVGPQVPLMPLMLH